MYDKKKLLDILSKEEYKTINNDGKVFPPSHAVYRSISETLQKSGSNITSKHIYTILKNDRNGIYSAVLKAFSLDKRDIYNESKDSSFNITKLSNSSTSEKVVKKFRLLISEEKWAQIKPTKMTDQSHCQRKYVSLQAGKWTHIFADKIWQQTKIPCAFTFKRAKIFKSSDAKCYAKFRGSCNECDAQLVGILFTKPVKKGDVIFECELRNYSSDVIHEKTRQLRGELRKKIATELVDGNKNANVWRNEEANKIMTFGDELPPVLYSTTVLRKAKQEELDKHLQLENTDPLQNLQIAKHIRLIGIIHNIGMDPFYCMYWTQEQQLMYKAAHKDKNSFLAIDATGSIGKKLRLPNDEKSSHLFLYECVCVSKHGNFPVFQMVSAKQDAAIISYFFLEIIRNGAPKPRIVVTDFGKAILIAVARVFANCTDLNHYLQTCYTIITDNYVDIPSCYMRLDVNHFIAMIARWDCLRGRAIKIRQFFLRCLARLYQMDNFDETHKFLKSLLIVALSEEIGNDNDTSVLLLPSEIHLIQINNMIKGITIDDPKDHENYRCIKDDEITAEGCWNTWAENVFLEAQKIANVSTNGTVVNAYYNVEAANKIKHLMCYLPLWTGIMRSHFKRGAQIATSSFVEAEFAELKTRAFKNQLPMRIDKFIFRHIEYLDGRLKLTCGSSKKKPDLHETETSPARTFEEDDVIDTSLKDTDLNEKELSLTKMSDEDNVIESPSRDNNVNLIISDEESSLMKVSSDQRYFAKSPSKQEDNLIESPSNDNYVDLIASDEESNLVKDQSNLTQSLSEQDNTDESFLNTDKDNLEQDSLNEIENWRCKIKRRTSANNETQETHVSKRRKPNYLTPCSDWDFSNTNTVIGLPILKNGSICKPAVVNKQQVVLRETCAFDSIFQIVANGMCISNTYKTNMTAFYSSNIFTKFTIDILKRGKIVANDYSARAIDFTRHTNF